MQYEIEDDAEASTQRTSEDGGQQVSRSQLNEPDLESDEVHSQTTFQKKQTTPATKAHRSRISKEETNIAQAAPSKIISDLFNYNSMASMKNFEGQGEVVSSYGSKKVLASPSSRLAGCFFNSQTNQMFTVDEYCLIRLWDLDQGICIRSYPLEVPNSTKEGELDDNLEKFRTKYHIQTMTLSDDCRVFVVALQGGVLQLNNAYSGAIMYNKAYENVIDLENEVACLSFFRKKTNIWVAATAWGGEVAFIQRPLTHKGPELVLWSKSKTSHTKDVTCLDITNSNHI